jgi:hypothetical protein
MYIRCISSRRREVMLSISCKTIVLFLNLVIKIGLKQTSCLYHGKEFKQTFKHHRNARLLASGFVEEHCTEYDMRCIRANPDSAAPWHDWQHTHFYVEQPLVFHPHKGQHCHGHRHLKGIGRMRCMKCYTSLTHDGLFYALRHREVSRHITNCCAVVELLW